MEQPACIGRTIALLLIDVTAIHPSTPRTRERIAAGLAAGFTTHGFAGRSVDELRDWSGVSLRTLYKYFPSREAMVVGALESRDAAYADWLDAEPNPGLEDRVAHVLHPLACLGDWLTEVANIGCLYLNALSEYPRSDAVALTVTTHKTHLADEFRTRLDRVAPEQDTGQLADTLFLLHEGMTHAARHQSVTTAIDAGLRAARSALAANGISEASDQPEGGATAGH